MAPKKPRASPNEVRNGAAAVVLNAADKDVLPVWMRIMKTETIRARYISSTLSRRPKYELLPLRSGKEVLRSQGQRALEVGVCLKE